MSICSFTYLFFASVSVYLFIYVSVFINLSNYLSICNLFFTQLFIHLSIPERVFMCFCMVFCEGISLFVLFFIRF